jgi:sugar phosphate isomerase/epimerase
VSCSLSLSTGCLAHLPVRYVFRLAHQCGFDGLELVRTPTIAMLRPSYLLRLSEQYQLPILSVHPSVIPYPGYDRASKVLPRLVDLARQVASPLVIVHTPKVHEPDDPLAVEFIQVLRREKERARPDVVVTVENAGLYGPEDTRYHLHNVRQLRELADQYDLSLTFDTSHAGTSPEGLDGCYGILRDRVVNVHLSDLLPRRLRPDWRFLQTLLVHHQMPGEGTLPLPAFLRHLAENGYSGILTLEPSPMALRAYSLARTLERLRQAVSFVRQALRDEASPG